MIPAYTKSLNHEIFKPMSLIILHDLNDEEVLVNSAAINAATRRYPDENAAVKDPFTKLFFASRDKGMEALGFPDSVKETPKEIWDLARAASK